MPSRAETNRNSVGTVSFWMNLIRAPEFEWSRQIPATLPLGDHFITQGAHACSLWLRNEPMPGGAECEMASSCRARTASIRSCIMRGFFPSITTTSISIDYRAVTTWLLKNHEPNCANFGLTFVTREPLAPDVHPELVLTLSFGSKRPVTTFDAVDGSPPRRQFVPPDRAGGEPWIKL